MSLLTTLYNRILKTQLYFNNPLTKMANWDLKRNIHHFPTIQEILFSHVEENWAHSNHT
jgi:hypothetical protein